MTQTDPAPTDLGADLPLPTPSPEWHERMSTRRSVSAQNLTVPGPSPAEIDTLLTLGARTPDHGKLFPWRFVVMGPDSRQAIAERLRLLATARPEAIKAAAVLTKLTAPPLSILVISSPVRGHKVPVWEQQLSAGAVCMNLEHAAGALGFASSWITDWYSYDAEASVLFGVDEGEQIAGFIHIGTVAEAPLERVRPDMATLTTTLS